MFIESTPCQLNTTPASFPHLPEAAVSAYGMPTAAPTDWLPGQTLHLVDLENLLYGSCFCTEAAVAVLHRSYRRLAGCVDQDRVVLATGSSAAEAGAWFGWPGQPRRLVRSGLDGADRELLSVLDELAIEDRFQRVVLASGDGIFAAPCAALLARGVHVTVVAANSVALSRRLKAAAIDIRFLHADAETVDYDPRLAA